MTSGHQGMLGGIFHSVSKHGEDVLSSQAIHINKMEVVGGECPVVLYR